MIMIIKMIIAIPLQRSWTFYQRFISQVLQHRQSKKWAARQLSTLVIMRTTTTTTTISLLPNEVLFSIPDLFLSKCCATMVPLEKLLSVVVAVSTTPPFPELVSIASCVQRNDAQGFLNAAVSLIKSRDSDRLKDSFVQAVFVHRRMLWAFAQNAILTFYDSIDWWYDFFVVVSDQTVKKITPPSCFIRAAKVWSELLATYPPQQNHDEEQAFDQQQAAKRRRKKPPSVLVVPTSRSLCVLTQPLEGHRTLMQMKHVIPCLEPLCEAHVQLVQQRNASSTKTVLARSWDLVTKQQCVKL
eukprot:PhM_4_TR2238/c0_g1_i1/m.70989